MDRLILEMEVTQREIAWENAKMKLKSAGDEEVRAFQDLIDARHSLSAYLTGRRAKGLTARRVS